MCGITGIIDFASSSYSRELISVVSHMTNTLIHRGPDDSGIWVDDNVGVALGHRRLSIIDLSPEGHQPMVSHAGRYVLAFNGEIYNFKTIRKELESKVGTIAWRGHSDTEVLLEAVEHWGLDGSLPRLNGMFAFALWDRKDRVLHLVRDRLGEKPLYYGRQGNVFLFGSELKALRAHPDFKSEINRDALALFLRHNCIPAPYSIYKDVFKVMPGNVLSISVPDKGNAEDISINSYWSVSNAVNFGMKNAFAFNDEKAVTELDTLLRDAIGLRMISDVPLGAFLSGGVDSSAVVALMQTQADVPVKTFSIGFENSAYNEALYAKEVARYLGTDHTELYVTSGQALDVIPNLPHYYDEPFSDSSQIPTFLVSQLAKKHVTVALSGDGGDELFAGYNRHVWAPGIFRKMQFIPIELRQMVAKILEIISPEHWDLFFGHLQKVIPSRLSQRNPGYKLHKLAEVLPTASREEMYKILVSHWKNPSAVVIGANEPPTTLTNQDRWPDGLDFTELMSYLDTVTYLPDDILTKVDRASMQVSLEARVPLLDHRVVEFAWQLPPNMKLRNGEGKWLLRQVLYQYVPKKIIERPKAGFGIPLGEWLRGTLKDWAEALLDETRLHREGFFHPLPIRNLWLEHLDGKRDWAYLLWNVLMFQAWLEKQ